MSGVPVAPNRAFITGTVRSVAPSTTSVGKWYLEVDVQEARAIEGGLFARPGTTARVFTFGDTAPITAGQPIAAEVEYLGGPTGGEFQLHRLVGPGVDTPEAAEPGG